MKVQMFFLGRADKNQINRFCAAAGQLQRIDHLQCICVGVPKKEREAVCSFIGSLLRDGTAGEGGLYYCNTDMENTGGVKAAIRDFRIKNPSDIMFFYGDYPGLYFGMSEAAASCVKCLTDVLDIADYKGEKRAQRKVYGAYADGWYSFMKKPAALVLSASGREIACQECNDIKIFKKEIPFESPVNLSAHILSSVPKPAAGSLCDAEVVFVGGRGLRKKENFNKMVTAAKRFGASWGCTRAAALSGWCGYSRVIGVSGVHINAKICVLFGVSGAAPFMFGVTNVENLIAINTDEDAPVFLDATYGIRGDCIELAKGLAKE